MAIKKVNPYINFNGNAEQAIKFYEKALGAKTEGLMRWGDVSGMNVAPEHKNRVMHSVLRFEGGELMISDGHPENPEPTQTFVHVVLDFTDVAEMTTKFDALAAGGKVTMPLNDTFWGAKFGMLTDAYGVRWMFNCDTKPR